MARITAGIASSHVPLLGVAVDQGKTHDDYFGPILTGTNGPGPGSARRSPM
mgnify:CR=1 FL=1